MRPLKDSNALRLNFYMKKELVEAIDEYADSLGITRSAAISVLCSTQLQSMTSLKNMGDMANAINGMSVTLLNKGDA